VMNMVDPIIQHISQNHANKKIGLIGTQQTVRSNLYKKRLDMLNQNIDFSSLATPLLVPLIEEGFADHAISETVIQEYLSRPALTNIDALILGCTHYPLLKNNIQKFYQYAIDIIDASDVTAHLLKVFLAQHQLLNPNKNQPSKKVFYVSDYTDFFANTAKIFFPGDIQLEPYPLWE
jgi:glutamate racemase